MSKMNPFQLHMHVNIFDWQTENDGQKMITIGHPKPVAQMAENASNTLTI